VTTVIQLSAPEYPARLAGMPRPPATLYVHGILLPRPERVVAIVGARAASRARMDLAHRLAAELAGQGAVVVSGGAVGIDAAAHGGALAAGGTTVAVLAGGLDAPYPPRNRPLFDQIAARGGALVSTQPDGTPPLRRLFVGRNGVIAGLADAVVVIQAEVGSGSLHTARAAQRYGRLVAAAPGSPGCEALLARGAAPVERAADLIDALAGRPRAPSIDLPAAGTREALALDALAADAPRTGAAVAAIAGLPLRDVNRALAGLELDGLALLMPGQAYLRSPLAERLQAAGIAAER
jgi:DNA processing protein